MAIIGQFVSVAFVFSVLLASASLLIPVELRVSYRRAHHDDHFYIEIKSLGGVIYHKFVIPIWDFRIDQLVPYLRLKSETLEAPNEQVSSRHDEHVIDSVERLRDKAIRLHRRWRQYRPVLKLILKHTHCTRFDWSTKLGVGDAAVTGVATGLVWTFKSMLLGWLHHQSQFDAHPRIAVRPHFSRVLFHTSFDCIFRIHLGDIMVVRLLLAKKE